jgi:hypothetical protein
MKVSSTTHRVLILGCEYYNSNLDRAKAKSPVDGGPGIYHLNLLRLLVLSRHALKRDNWTEVSEMLWLTDLEI